MKEQFYLTDGQEILYPGVRAPNQSRHSADGSGLEKIIFTSDERRRQALLMAENQEAPKSPETPRIESTSKTPSVPPERKVPQESGLKTPEKARKEWEEHLGGKPLTEEQKWLAGRGIGPEEEQELRQRHPKGEVTLSGGAPTTLSEFIPEIESLLQEIKTPVFRALLARTGTASVEELREIYDELKDRYKDIWNELFQEREGDTEIDRIQRQQALQRIQEERDKIIGLIVRIMPEQIRGLDSQTITEIKNLEEEVEKIKNLPEDSNERLNYRKKLKDLLVVFSPHDEVIPDRVMKLIASDKIITEEFISRLIVSNLEDQPHQIRSFYGGTNFEKFLRLMPSMLPRDQEKHLLNLIAANEVFHNMNYIIRRNFDQFAQQSESLLPQHFVALSQISGVDIILRLYEEAYQETLGIETRITEEAFQEMDENVYEEFLATLNKKDATGKQRIPGLNGEKMEDWEVNRAFIFARNFYRILVRAAEHISLSELQKGGDPAIWTSSPQKNFAQILNNFKLIGLRFMINEPLGGPLWLDRVIKNNNKRKDKRIEIKTLQGTSLEMRELQGIVGARGVMLTWRNAQTILREIKFKDNGNRETDIVQFFLDHKEEIANLKDLSKRDWEIKGKPGGGFEEWKKLQFRDFFNPLLDNTSIALGVLVSGWGLGVPAEFKELVWEKVAKLDPLVTASLLRRLEMANPRRDVESLEDILLDIWGTEEQKEILGKAGLKRKKDRLQELLAKKENELKPQEVLEIKTLREEINNPTSEEMSIRELEKKLEDKASILAKLTAKKEERRSPLERQEIENLSKEIGELRISYGEKDKILKELFRGEKWRNLAKKLRLANELRIKEETERLKEKRFTESPKTLADFLIDEELVLNDDEKKVLERIMKNGEKIAPDLARIRQSHVWFLDDVPFKVLNWTSLGQFYDRQTGDLGQFHKAAQALIKIMANPFGQPVDEILKHMAEAIEGSANVLGLQDAQDRQAPAFESWIDFIYEIPKFRQKFISMARHGLRKATSEAQEIVGVRGPAVDEDGLDEILNKAVPMGILRRAVFDEKTGKEKWADTYNEFSKKYGTVWYKRLLWAKLRDYGPFFFLILLLTFFKSVAKEKA